MAVSRNQNPFEVLRLDPSADNEQVVAQAGRLRQRAAGEEEVNAIRQAVQSLTGSAEERFLHEMLTHPRAGYDWPALDRFRAAFRRAPPPPAGEAPPNADKVALLLRTFLGGEPHPAGPENSPRDNGPQAEEADSESMEVAWRRLAELQ
jgi:hypothetical protein